MTSDKLIEEFIKDLHSFEYCHNIDELINELEGIKKDYALSDYVELCIYNNRSGPKFSLYGYRYETEKEIAKRVKQEIKEKERAEKKKYKEYLKLKKEFENVKSDTVK